ncbi:FRG domain-containing protein [Burkholderia glumae]|uniref:FRG domain-containing protein n=1 Tax=Burkholderia glumae TaxID=337 RepID=UPI002151AE58|nr:FRG domain-containing protein [Burkholderia glumae]
MNDTVADRKVQSAGEARNLGTFLQLVHDWTEITPTSGLAIPLFRGQEDESWLLKPGIARAHYAERLQPDTEARMLAEFKARAIPHLESATPLTDADWLAIAQHHAMPTRLLDWSGSALTALWFAIKRPAVTPHGKKQPSAAAVWMLAADESDLITDDERANPLALKRTKLIKPRHVSRRIAAQDGWFSVHNGLARSSGQFYVSLDTNRLYKSRLSYIRIPPAAFGLMRTQLQLAGINRGVLFPDLDGVAGRIADAYLYPDDQQPARLGRLAI